MTFLLEMSERLYLYTVKKRKDERDDAMIVEDKVQKHRRCTLPDTSAPSTLLRTEVINDARSFNEDFSSRVLRPCHQQFTGWGGIDGPKVPSHPSKPVYTPYARLYPRIHAFPACVWSLESRKWSSTIKGRFSRVVSRRRKVKSR